MFVGAVFCLLLHFTSICSRDIILHAFGICVRNFRSNGTSFRCNWIFTFENLGARCAFCNIPFGIIEVFDYSLGNPATLIDYSNFLIPFLAVEE